MDAINTLTAEVQHERGRIFLPQGMNPEGEAMLQALYSRSGASVMDHLEKVQAVGSDKFMSTYYVGYGHKSIGDCGTITLFYEDVSLLAAKAIQQWPLYSGQESSTRFMNMAERPVVLHETSHGELEIVERAMRFYKLCLVELPDALRRRFPRKPEDKEEIYEKAIAAKAFDIARGWLPAGVTTQLSWHSNLRQLADHIESGVGHPAREIANIFQSTLAMLRKVFPSSFGSDRASDEQRMWTAMATRNSAAVTGLFPAGKADSVTGIVDVSVALALGATEGNTFAYVATLLSLLKDRPPRTKLPYDMGTFAKFTVRGFLDFAGFRDLQRHRNRLPVMPLLDPSLGVHPWYFDNLTPSLREEASALEVMVEGQFIHSLQRGADKYELQYMVPIGFQVPVYAEYPLDAFVYLMELRSTKFIHPTLRNLVLGAWDKAKHHFPDGGVFPDLEPSEWDVRRGAQDITEKSDQ